MTGAGYHVSSYWPLVNRVKELKDERDAMEDLLGRTINEDFAEATRKAINQIDNHIEDLNKAIKSIEDAAIKGKA
jgi:uncharacterized coiled-coil DUF342 family protein